jgi:hypothetical protein
MFYILAILAPIFVMPARADETLKFRYVYHFTSNQTQQVGDVNGHVIGLGHLPGIVLFPDGSTGTTMIVGTYDVIAPPGEGGTTNGYQLFSFDDGSELWTKYTGATKYSATGKVALKCNFLVISGKGRYEGAKGDGTCEGEQTRSGAVGGAAPEAIGALDAVLNIKK